ncbi:MAG: TIGR00725 family protein [Candidatus Aegiribacteria sp.]|nr:TIGR00725 family protein [Candidatus Aegiribacteria sp.]MBD3294506.1 TIGR00725 family protein [Candidatus Fermentibacteria bacterium]
MSDRSISVIGGSAASSKSCAHARKLGEMLAEAGYTVICGGGSGVMEAVCLGAKEKGGRTVGILPGADPSEANRWVDIAVVTGMGTARNRIIALTGEAVCAIDGGPGTLSEIAYALQAGKPVCAMGKWSGIEGVIPVDSVESAMEFLKEHTKGEGC